MRRADRYDLRELERICDASPTELPLRVVPDWDEQLARADSLCRLIDRHLKFEARRHSPDSSEHFRPEDLGAAPRVQLIADVLGLIRRR